VKVDGKFEDAYYFCAGGSVGMFASIARPVGYRCRAAEVPEALERLLRRSLEMREPAEDLRPFLAKHTTKSCGSGWPVRKWKKRSATRRRVVRQLNRKLRCLRCAEAEQMDGA
jgi:hypothetical protein